MDKAIEGAALFMVAVAVGIILGALTAWPVMVIWNDTMPALFGLKSVTFAQAWELMILCSFLFRSYGSSK